MREEIFDKYGDEITKRLQNNLCPRCMCILEFVEVHGHRQCKYCNCIIQDCCDGEKDAK
jgi:hypothetical protein